MDAAGSGHESGGSGAGHAGGGPSDVQVLQYCDFADFIRTLDIDPSLDASEPVMVAAQWMFASPLPPHWSEQIDESSSRVYFFNRATGESLWMHPREALFKEIIEEVRQWPPDQSLEATCGRSDAHLRQAHSRAVETIKQWSAYSVPQGPEEAPELGRAAQFYFHAASGESSWVDPREDAEFDLRLRHSILCECVASHSQALNRMASSDSSDGDLDGRLSKGGAQALVRSLWESLAPLPPPLAMPVRPADLPPVDSSPGRRPSTALSQGDDTVRSSLTYLSARSTMSCAEEARGAHV
uniref:WW domain-containing protein n=1 Tax=Pyrodinium bahamense TaxID=73915 RepID=A0A7S0FRQ4_9DINO